MVNNLLRVLQYLMLKMIYSDNNIGPFVKDAIAAFPVHWLLEGDNRKHDSFFHSALDNKF